LVFAVPTHCAAHAALHARFSTVETAAALLIDPDKNRAINSDSPRQHREIGYHIDGFLSPRKP
jgi:hypothetical protein